MMPNPSVPFLFPSVPFLFISMPNPSVPFLFIDVPGTTVRSASGSHSNAVEANTCRELVTALLTKNIPPTSIAIITFYKEQLGVMERFANQHQIDLHTVDSVQGREKDIVILLTTRTAIQVNRVELLDDTLRMNVAMTRCCHGQFVLGNAPHFRHCRTGAVSSGGPQLYMVVSTTTLPDLLD
ncbi:hypothetical protein ANCCEY_07901 [Ancylostoma ceylanicum]|uniref:DNA2/NAM7 helicase-like C-terminal domain-containing protein n=1 Tax=Ancylostoma ceylanicum TaxID=53326 RepID=A0A0D6LLN8_9BILA|nr:hypothetical protein ANCCEY_07901 [Ancylostoma ceylanicum]